MSVLPAFFANLRMNQSLRALAVVLIGWSGSFVLGTAAALPVPEAAVVAGSRANLRAAASINADVVGSLPKGQVVTVLEQIPVSNPQADEPTSWAKIRLPASVKVWVFAAFIDTKSGAVTSSELKVRTGAGKNYPAVGELDQGDLVVPLRTVDGWTQIQAPAAAVAYVAGDLLQMTGAPAAAAGTPTSPTTKPRTPGSGSAVNQVERAPLSQPVAPGNPAPPRELPKAEPLTPASSTKTATTVPHKIDVVSQSATPAPGTDRPATPVSPAVPSATPVAAFNQVAPTVPATPIPVEIGASVQYRQPELVYDDKRPRRVLREGVVGLTISPDGPGWYQLDSFRRGESILDYLIVEDVKQTDLAKWRGKRVFIEGDEYRDRRWRTPVLKVVSIRPAF